MLSPAAAPAPDMFGFCPAPTPGHTHIYTQKKSVDGAFLTADNAVSSSP